jgi:Spy/CpxP family protein refolding chaperone
MNKTVFSAVVAVLLAAVAFSIASAQGGGPRGRGPGGPGFGGPRLGALARLADLTDEQKQQIQSILEEDRALRQGPPKVVSLHHQLEAELLADTPDDQKIETLRQQLVQAQGEEVAQQITLQRKIAAVLTAEQRAKAREHLAERPHGRRMQGGAASK